MSDNNNSILTKGLVWLGLCLGLGRSLGRFDADAVVTALLAAVEVAGEEELGGLVGAALLKFVQHATLGPVDAVGDHLDGLAG